MTQASRDEANPQAEIVPPREVVAIIVNYRTPKLVDRCLRSLVSERRLWKNLRVLVVDGGSDDGSAKTIAASIAQLGIGGWADFEALPINGGFAYANNQAILRLAARGALPDFILLLNPDAELEEGAIELLVRLLERRPTCGAVGAQLLDEAGRPQQSAFRLPTAAENFVWAVKTSHFRRLFGRERPPLAPERALQVDVISGSAMLLRRRALEAAGLFNDSFFLYFEETELCYRLARVGWEVWMEPAARVVHLGSGATKLFDPATGILLPQRLPAYWFESWWRYFLLSRGNFYALAAGAAWTLGHWAWLIRAALTRLEVDQPPHLVGDFWRAGLRLVGRDRAAAASIGDPPGAAPAWMRPDR